MATPAGTWSGRLIDLGNNRFADTALLVDSAGNEIVLPVPSEVHLGAIGAHTATPSSSFTRPADTTAYASGDLVASSTTAGSVTPLSFTAARVAAGSFSVLRGRIKKSGTSATNAAFRIHLFTVSPTVTSGDNGAFAIATGIAGYLGYLDVTSMQTAGDGCMGHGAPNVGSAIVVDLSSGQVIYGLLEARGAYTPDNAETFDVCLEVFQDGHARTDARHHTHARSLLPVARGS
jgi:hypothetical protein